MSGAKVYRLLGISGPDTCNCGGRWKTLALPFFVIVIFSVSVIQQYHAGPNGIRVNLAQASEFHCVYCKHVQDK